MEYRRLGRSGMRVSEISLGSWLTFGNAVDRETARQTVQKAVELGINFFDTANVYALGEAERVLGEALRPFPRESYVLATKVFGKMGSGPSDRGLSRKHVMEQAEASLRRLGVDYVDLYYCHRYDEETPLDETLRALDDLVRQGKVLYTGVSEWSPVQIADAAHLAGSRSWTAPVANQPIYNLLNRYIEKEIIPLCETLGVGQVVFSPLAQGLLTGKYRPSAEPPGNSRASDSRVNAAIRRILNDESLEKAERLRAVAKEAGMPLSRLALAFVLRQKNVASALTGASRPEQVEENVQASGITLDGDLLAAIESALA